MPQTKPKRVRKGHTAVFPYFVVVAIVKGRNGKYYVIQKRRAGEWRCNCRTPLSICDHMRRTWDKGIKGKEDPDVSIEVEGAM